ncbi:hypothetical protein H8S90_08870 [Olivibacter sp. SDN3]|nr:hypothetical protein [Olivibacter sp. SDN3]QNL51665.1 hypothetical protein H8S90_08870 [Olivibacter sp. SDN3]
MKVLVIGGGNMGFTYAKMMRQSGASGTTQAAFYATLSHALEIGKEFKDA